MLRAQVTTPQQMGIPKQHVIQKQAQIILNEMCQFVGLLDTDGNLLEINQVALDVSGIKRSEVLGYPLWQAPWWTVSVETQQQLRAAITEAARDNFVRYEVEIFAGAAGKELFTIDFSLKPVKDSTRQVGMLILEGYDVTKYKQTEAALRASEAWFRRAILKTPFPLMIHAEDGEVLQISEAWTELTGYAHDNISTITDWTAKAYGQARELVKQDIARLYNLNTRVEEGEYTITTSSGETRIWDFSSAPLGKLPDKRRFVISVATDITERKQAEAVLRDSEQTAQRQVEELEKLNRLKDDFLSTVSHELRSPMANIKMAIQMLKVLMDQGTFDVERSKATHYLQILQSECQRETNLINDLLDLQHFDVGTKPLVLEVVQLQTWFLQVVNPFLERTQVLQQILTIDIPCKLPLLTSDLSSLERILVELLNNACKYTPTGERIKVTAQAKPEIIQLKVANSGVVIPSHELPRIFEKFYRIPTADP